MARHSSPLRLRAFLVTLRPNPGLAPLCPTTPRGQRPGALTPSEFGLFPVRSPLLGESHFAFFSSGYLDVSVPPVRLLSLQRGYWRFAPVGCPIRESPDQRLLTATRGLSQLAAPFIASWRQGIHHVPFLNLTANLSSFYNRRSITEPYLLFKVRNGILLWWR